MDIFTIIKHLKYCREPFPKEIIDKIKHFEHVIIWGGGQNARKALKMLNANQINVECFYDDSPLKQNTIFEGISMLAPDIENTKGCALIIACIGYNKIYERLLPYNKDIKNQMFLFEAHEIEEDYSIEYILKQKDKIEQAYQLMSDNKSKEIFLGLIKYRYSRNPYFIESFVDDFDTQYLDSVLVNNFKNGYIIDAGAFTGDSIIKFNKKIKLDDSYIYAFEPDADLCIVLQENLKSFKNYEVFPIALYNERTTISFNTSTSGAGTISIEGNQIVETDLLDRIIKDENVSLIKMDIEGAELSALEGAIVTISKNKPLCAISIYHKRDDLWNIPLFINGLNCKYDFYLRHYTFSLSETVLYCIPK